MPYDLSSSGQSATIRGLGVACSLSAGFVRECFTAVSAQFDPDQFFTRPRDRRLLSPLMVFGAVAAEAALRSAGLGATERAKVQARIATANGDSERGVERDILRRCQVNPTDVSLNEALSMEMSPLTAVKRLPNMLAGHLACRSGVLGTSRTYIGGPTSATDALRSAFLSLGLQNGGPCLVGGAFSLDGEELMRRSLANLLIPQTDMDQPTGAAVFLLLDRPNMTTKSRPWRGPQLLFDRDAVAPHTAELGAVGIFFELAEAILKVGGARILGGIAVADADTEPVETIEGSGWRVTASRAEDEGSAA